MTKPHWRFAPATPGIRENEQTQEEFFSNAEVVSEVAGLVRESIQNSLDEVKDKNSPIRMVFTVGLQPSSVSSQYFADLYPHLQTAGLPDLPDFSRTSRYLIIEDFNTLGLEGPTTSVAPPENDPADLPYKRSFWYFEWKTGASNKSAGNRGSWGVGKIVFPRASRIKSYLVLSVRGSQAAPDGDPSILFGHSILKYRITNGVRYVPDCQWMVDDPNGLPIPSRSRDAQKKFSEDWNLTRRENELGTSIVIPFCQDSLNVDQLVKNIIRDYFIAILSGLLECEVRDGVGSSITINQDNLDALIDEYLDSETKRSGRSKGEMKAICAMYRSFLGGSYHQLNIGINNQNPNDWDSIQIDENELRGAASEYENGKVIQVKVRTRVPEMKNPNLTESSDEFMVLLQRSSEPRSSTVFCREGILIPNANKNSIFQNRISMVFVGKLDSVGEVENSLANLLKNAEGPSHETWSTTASKFRGRYSPPSFADRTIRWVKQSTDRLFRLLEGQDNVEDDTSLSKYFPLKDAGSNDGSMEIKLKGRRVNSDSDFVVFSWTSKGFTADSYELLQISPSEAVVATGPGIGGRESLSIGKNQHVLKFQLVARAGDIKIHSNVVPVFPIGTVPEGELGIVIVQSRAGFAIKSTAERSKLKVGQTLVVSCAYKLSGGQKLIWDPEDFDMRELFQSSTMQGLKVLLASGNQYRFEITDKKINAEWIGFDWLRDLRINTKLEDDR